MVTILKGVSANKFDRKTTASRTAQTTDKPTVHVGLMQTIIGVGWSTGRFSIVAGQTVVTDTICDIGGIPIPSTRSVSTCKSAISKDAKSWKETLGLNVSGAQVAGCQGGGGSMFRCSITGSFLDRSHASRSTKKGVVAGGLKAVPLQLPGEEPTFTTEPMAAYSTDGGATWIDAGMPSLDPIVGDNGVGGFVIRQGVVNAMGYDPKTGRFFATVLYAETGGSDDKFVLKCFVGDPGAGWDERSSQNVPQGGSTGFPLPEWPAGIHMCDNNVLGIGSIGIVVKVDPHAKYCSCNGPGQIMRVGKHTLELTADGHLLFDGGGLGVAGQKVQSAAMSGKTIIAVTYDENAVDPFNAPHIYRALGEGSLQSILPELAGPNGTGSVSFS